MASPTVPALDTLVVMKSTRLKVLTELQSRERQAGERGRCLSEEGGRGTGYMQWVQDRATGLVTCGCMRKTISGQGLYI